MKSVRDLSKSLGLSCSTVYEALRNSSRVKKETRDFVLKAAQAEGVKYNAMVSSLMSEVRKSTTMTFRGVLAIVDLESAHSRIKSPRNSIS